MDFINALVAQFYAIPAVADIVNSHAILRVATKQYGTPLLGLIILFIVLMLVLVLSRLGKKSNKPKPVREKKQKPKKAPRQKAAKPAKVKGPNKAIMTKLAKLPKSTLPLYPVADKRKTLDDALNNAGDHAASVAAPMIDQPPTAPEAVVDEASLIQGLDDMPPTQPEDEVVATSFSLTDETAAQMMRDHQPAAAKDDFDMPPAMMDNAPEDRLDDIPQFSDEPPLTATDADDDLPPLTIDPIVMDDETEGDGNTSEGQTIDPVPSLDFDPIEPLPEEEKPMDDGESIDIPVGSFGSGDEGDLSGAAQEKLAELNDRGVT